MQAERWKSVEKLYDAAIALPPEKRGGFLEEACSDVQLRGEVQSLLDQQTGGFLEDSPLSLNLQKGVKLGSFEMVERIGKGGMGEVWRAKDTRLGRDVAIKLLPGAFARDPDRIARFEHEARAASALNHPNVVSVFDIGSENGVYWIVSELVDGESLQRLMSKGRLPVQRAIEIAAQIADGLAAAHATGIIHRDLKPGNIMLRRDGRVKIVDFGLAKRVFQSPESATLTESGVILGTAGYMSPEQVRGEPADARSDIFSFGVIVYEMLAGRAAFTGASSIELMNGILKDDPAELPSSTPAGLSRIVRRCLEKQPDRRFQSAADLAFALVSSPETPALPPKRSRLRLAWLATTAALVLAAAGLTWWLATRSQHSLWMPDATLRQLTHDAGLTADPAISADGKLVAYASDRADPDNLDIWVQQVDGGSAARITNDPADDEDPTFSPDASQIAFRSDREGGGIYTVAALGGEARLLVPMGRRPRFSPNGRLLMYTAGDGGLYVQRLDEGVNGIGPSQIGAGCNVFPTTAVWSPDSSRVLFWAVCESSNYQIWLSTLDGKRIAGPRPLPEPPLPEPFGDAGEIDQWLPDPSRLLFVAWAANGSSIATVLLSEDAGKITGPMQRITFGAGSARHVSRAANGRIAFESGSRDAPIWGIPIDGDGHATGEPGRLTSQPRHESFALSRDGKSLAVVRDDGLYYRNLTTGKEREVLHQEGLDSVVFGSDAMTLMFSVDDPHPGGGIYEMPISGGATKKIWDEPASWVNLCDWAPDDGTVLFARLIKPNDPGRIFEKDLKSLSTTTFLDDPDYEVWNARFSHDGRWVTFNATPRGRTGRSEIYVVPFRKALAPRSEWIPVTAGRGGDKPRPSWDDKLMFFSSDRDGFRCIWAQRLGPEKHTMGEPFAVQHFHQRRRSLSNLNIGDFDMAVGPKTIVFNQAEVNSNIWLLDPGKAAK